MVVINRQTGAQYYGKFVCFRTDIVDGIGKVIDFNGDKRFYPNYSSKWKVEQV